jgi:hypothetical protein
MNFVGKLGAWVIYFGVVGLILNMGWREPLKNHFLQNNSGSQAADAPTAAPGEALTPPQAPPVPTPPVANGQTEQIDYNVKGNRRVLIFSTPAP